jgi:glycosyltransferase involved in cell wall biosynthesis
MSGAEQTPMVSVVMATYGGDALPLLRRAVDSVLTQTLDDLELLVVADGPLDPGTDAWLESRATEDPRLRVLHLEANRGPAAARNRGFAEARGRYIAVADADDRSLPERLARQVAWLEEQRLDLAGTYLRYLDEDGRLVAEKELPISPEAVRRAALWFSPVNNPTVLARAQVLRENSYDERFRFAEDYDLWVRLLRRGFRLGNQPEVLYEMRVPAGFSRRRSGWRCFANDLATRWRALALYPAWQRPALAGLALGLSALRLLPGAWMGLVYRARHRVRFKNDAG